MQVFCGPLLVAVLVRLDAEFYDNDRGRWHLEIGFGRVAPRLSTFDSLEIALRCIADCLDLDADGAAECATALISPASH